MKYPWASLAIIAFWLGSTLIILYRQNSEPTLVLLFAAVATSIIAFSGFKSPQ